MSIIAVLRGVDCKLVGKDGEKDGRKGGGGLESLFCQISYKFPNSSISSL